MSNLIEARKVVAEHQAHERFLQGSWIYDKDDSGVFRGCFYGCTMQTDLNPIEDFCEKYNMPLWIGYWSEKVFEGLPKNECSAWPLQLLDALIAFKGDLEIVKHKLAIKRLSFLLKRSKGNIKNAIDGVIDCHKRVVDGEKNVDFSKARSAAWAAACAAESAGEAAARSAALVAAWTAESEAEAAAESAAWAAESAAESARLSGIVSWQNERDWMLEILTGGE